MKSFVEQIKRAVRCPRQIFGGVFALFFSKSPLSDNIYLKVLYRLKTGKKLNLKNPVLFNEKLQWLKLYNRNPEYSDLVDKYEVRKYISQTIGEEYLIPLYGVWDSFEEIPFDTLPDQFVLKCTHDCGSVVICKDKKALNIKKIGKYLKKCLANNHYWKFRERHYKNVKPRIIAEKLMIDESGTELKDYKIFCFNGEPKFIQVDYNRFIDHKKNLFDTDWNYLDFSLGFPNDKNKEFSKPQNLNKMLELAKNLSAGIPFVRVDLYYPQPGVVYFGELTFYPGGGFLKFVPAEWNKTFGDWMILPVD